MVYQVYLEVCYEEDDSNYRRYNICYYNIRHIRNADNHTRHRHQHLQLLYKLLQVLTLQQTSQLLMMFLL